MVQKVFGFQRYPPGWQIEKMHRQRDRRNYNAVFNLLRPAGPLFTLIKKLQGEDIGFEFPYHALTVRFSIMDQSTCSVNQYAVS